MVNPLAPVSIVTISLVSATLDNYLRRFTIISLGGSNIANGTAQSVTQSNYSSILNTNQEDSKQLQEDLVGFFSYNPSGQVLVLELGKTDEGTNTESAQIQVLTNYIENSSLRSYMYLLPSSWYSKATTNGLITLLQKYNNVNSAQYFIINKDNEDVSTDTVLSSLNNIKSIMVCFNTVSSATNIAACVLGIVASSYYDLSSSMPSSPLAYKAISGRSLTSLTSAQSASLTEKDITFGAVVAGIPCIINGKYQDGYSFEYWFNYDYMCYTLTNELTRGIINSSNSPQDSIPYSQVGIDIGRVTITGRLSQLVSIRVLTEFGMSYNTNTGTIVGKNDITAIDYADYIKEHPQDYQDEIYAGYSFYVRIGKFIKAIQLQVTKE